HDETMQKRGSLLKRRCLLSPSLLDFCSNQTRGVFAHHESTRPALAGIKELLVTPKHFQGHPCGFPPPNFVINVPFPRRRLTGHEIEIKRGWPTENAVTDSEESLIARRRRSSEMLGSILGCGFKRAKRENLAAARQCELVVLG